MHVYLGRFGVLCGASLLMACAGDARRTGADADADAAYGAGRALQMAHSSDAAMRAYKTVLTTSPQHVDARNGMASILAERGDMEGAIALWQGLIAERGSDAYLFGNLGHAYFLSGRYAEAQQAQQRACLLDPANAQHWQRLASTLEKIGDAERALRMQRQALALLEHDLPTDVDVVGVAGIAGMAQLVLIQGIDGMLTLQRTEHPTSLEIANGNGVPGMARATARRLLDPALRVALLSNAAGFGVQHTRIEYRPAARTAAERLAQQIQPDAVLIAATRGLGTDLRLVLGRNARPRV